VMSWEQIPGWFDWHEFVDRAVADAPRDRPSVFVEVGVAFGRSLAYTARRCIDSGKNIQLFCADPWIDDWNPDWDQQDGTRPTWGAEHAGWAREQGGPFSAFLKMMQTHAPEEMEFCKVARARGVDLAAMLRARVELPHYVWIDGDHRYAGVTADLRSWRWRTGVDDTILRPRWFGGHDYTPDFPGVQQAVREAFGDLPQLGSSWLLAPEDAAVR
jgi:hypothetical protein